ncbi:MAG: arginine--tRNA ligase [Candidatus Bathyarchaeota archaeon]|nr:arginine--tRNA ligase [Candidatus Bathyarchaeota archaeon]MDH5494662.1 arginine--tRNA ligase [Candidatus Bathyarchaeota archaeon]
MVSINPFGDFRKDCERALRKSFTKFHPSISGESFLLDIPPDPEFGELASAVFFELGKKMKEQPRKLADQIVNAIEVKDFPLINAVEAAGEGYVNFYVNFSELSKVTIDAVRTLDTTYGYVKTEKPEKVIVEHTSANPISPINIGKARNPVLGDSLARILTARGHKVFRHFYVDDVGRQTAVIAYGYRKLGKSSLEGKSDHYIGLIYTVTSCIIEINRLKRAIEKKRKTTSETVQQLRKQLDEWISIAAELENKYPKLFSQLLEKIGKDKDSEIIVNSLNRAYETGEEKAKKLIRGVCQLSLDGIKETLASIKVFFDSWDWESDFAWNSDVAKTLEALKKTGYVFREGPVLEFDADKVAEDLKLKQTLGLKNDYEIPSLTLVRADGTTLYTTRDIPYTLWKFKKATKVINVVGMEQKLSQQQLKLTLWALGHTNKAKNLTHFAYNLVTLPGYKMSSRRGHYITLDEVMDEAIKRAREEVEKRSPQLSYEEKLKISKIVGIGALKYALVEVDPIKPVVFTWDRVINFERNSAPYIQYSYARARSILRKAPKEPEKPDYSLLVEPLERDLVLALARFPEVFVDSAENLKSNAIADFANILADKFNSFYNALPVIKAKPKALSDARLALVEAISIVLRNALSLIGIVAPEKM